MPHMNGGGDTGEWWEAVASSATSQPSIRFVAISISVTFFSGSPSLCTVFPSNSASSPGISSISAPIFRIFSFNSPQAFTVAMPVM